MDRELLRTALQKIPELLAINKEFMQEQIRKYRKYSRREHIDYERTLAQVHTTYQPCFVLSTGRTGTTFLTTLLNLAENVSAYHGQRQAFRYYRRFAYDLNRNQSDPEALKQVLEATRTEALVKEYISGKIYVETDPRITFFAPQLAELYAGARFIHIVRHPGAFVRSRMRGETYLGNSLDDLGTITDTSNELWGNLSRLERISWLWNETNAFVEDFKDSLDDRSRVITIKSEDMFSDVTVIRSIFDFFGAKYIGDRRIEKMLHKPVNKRLSGSFPRYEYWSAKQKRKMIKWVNIHKLYSYKV